MSLLSLSGVSKSVGGELVLRRVSLHLGPGDVLIVRGRSGVGKTTLAKIVSLQLIPDEGVVEFMGHDMIGLSDSARSALRLKYVGYVDQEFTLLQRLTIYDNVELPLALLKMPRNERRRLVAEALSHIGLEGMEQRYPSELSCGERQRVAIARAVVKKPRLLVADEPFSNLDDVTTSTITELFKRLSRELGTSILVTTTDLSTEYGVGVSKTLEHGELT
ncbi:MAG: ATP-binding cassette domain-containing protein [Zestosphaera sp.]